MTRSVEIPEAERERVAGVLHGFEHDRLRSRCPGSDECELWQYAVIRVQLVLAAQPVDREALAKAWDEGHSTGWKNHQDGNYGNDYWDDTTPNPYRLAGEQEQVEK